MYIWFKYRAQDYFGHTLYYFCVCIFSLPGLHVNVTSFWTLPFSIARLWPWCWKKTARMTSPYWFSSTWPWWKPNILHVSTQMLSNQTYKCEYSWRRIDLKFVSTTPFSVTSWYINLSVLIGFILDIYQEGLSSNPDSSWAVFADRLKGTETSPKHVPPKWPQSAKHTIAMSTYKKELYINIDFQWF